MSDSPIDRKAGRDDGERRKDAAHGLLEARRELYVRRGRRALLDAVLNNGSATMDDVRDVVSLPGSLDPKLFGAVPGPLARDRIIRAAGFERTCRPTAHARPLTRWELLDRHRAERWLLDHPDPDDAEAAVVPALSPLPTNEPGAAAGTVTPGN